MVPSYWKCKHKKVKKVCFMEDKKLFLSLFSGWKSNFLCPPQTLFHVINRKTGKAVSTRFYGDAMVVFHHINAYESDGHVVFDLISYDNSNLYDMFYIQNMKQETSKFIESNKSFSLPVCQRFVLPLNANKVQLEIHPKHHWNFEGSLVLMKRLCRIFQDSPRGSNLVTLEDTTAQAVMQEDGSIHCQPDTLFEGSLSAPFNSNF